MTSVRVKHVSEEDEGECVGYTYHTSVKKAREHCNETGGRVVDTAPSPKTQKMWLALLRR